MRDSSYFPSLLEPRRRAERALSAVVQEAYVHGVSPRKVDDLVKALGMTGIRKSRVSELCAELDEEHRRGQDQEGDHPLPEAIHRPRGLPGPSFAVPKQAPDFGALTNIEASLDRTHTGPPTPPMIFGPSNVVRVHPTKSQYVA